MIGRLVQQPGVARHAALGQHGVEEHGVHSPDRQVGIGMHVVLVDHRHDAVLLPGALEDVRGQRRAERRHPAAAQCFQRRQAGGVALPHRQHLAELVIGDGHRQPGTAAWQVFEAAQSDVEVAALDGRIEGGEPDLHEPRRAAEARREQCRDIHFEADHARRIARIGLHERRPAFGVAAEAQDARVLRHRAGGQQTADDGGEDEGPSHRRNDKGCRASGFRHRAV